MFVSSNLSRREKRPPRIRSPLSCGGHLEWWKLCVRRCDLCTPTSNSRRFSSIPISFGQKSSIVIYFCRTAVRLLSSPSPFVFELSSLAKHEFARRAAATKLYMLRIMDNFHGRNAPRIYENHLAFRTDRRFRRGYAELERGNPSIARNLSRPILGVYHTTSYVCLSE